MRPGAMFFGMTLKSAISVLGQKSKSYSPSTFAAELREKNNGLVYQFIQ